MTGLYKPSRPSSYSFLCFVFRGRRLLVNPLSKENKLGCFSSQRRGVDRTPLEIGLGSLESLPSDVIYFWTTLAVFTNTAFLLSASAPTSNSAEILCPASDDSFVDFIRLFVVFPFFSCVRKWCWKEEKGIVLLCFYTVKRVRCLQNLWDVGSPIRRTKYTLLNPDWLKRVKNTFLVLYICLIAFRG